jgi:hypothetical protein
MAAALTGTCTLAHAEYIITQGASAPQYSGYQIDFDQPGDPVGAIVGDEWQASHGITLMSGVGDGGVVDDWDSVYGPWGLGDAMSHWGSFGTFLSFDYDVQEMSFQVWNNGTDPFWGGIGVYLFNDGNEVAFLGTIPAWAGEGDSWFNITTTDGDAFDEVRIIDWDFSSLGIFTDNYSWNQVPSPGALALLSLAGIVARRRRS